MQPQLHRQSAEIAALCRRLHVARLDVFGSAVREDFDSDSSDLDFVVEFEQLPPSDYADAYFSLKEGLEAMFGRPVDLVTPSSMANPYFRDSVTASRKNLYAA